MKGKGQTRPFHTECLHPLMTYWTEALQAGIGKSCFLGGRRFQAEEERGPPTTQLSLGHGENLAEGKHESHGRGYGSSQARGWQGGRWKQRDRQPLRTNSYSDTLTV